MILRRVIPSQLNSGQRHALTVGLLSTLTEEWTPNYLTLLINANSVPKKHIDTILAYLGKHTSLLTIQKDEFLEATNEARPDLYPLLTSPAGDRWLEHAMADLGKALVVRSAQWLIAGGR